MSVRIDYDQMTIYWYHWNDVPKIYQLFMEMIDNNYQWNSNDIVKYLNMRYSIDLSLDFIKSDNKYPNELHFYDSNEMWVFMVHFMTRF